MKTPKSYRLSQTTLNRLHWLATHLKTTETDVIENAVTDLYMREYYSMPDLHTAPTGPRCSRPLCSPCPLESIIAAGLDITCEDCTKAQCPHLVR